MHSVAIQPNSQNDIWQTSCTITMQRGDFMKTQIKLNSTFLKLALIAFTTALMTACGTSKSNPTTSTSNSTAYDFASAKPLANCNKTKDSNFSINTSSVTDSNGQTSSEWIKLKFNFLSSTVTTSGNVIKFFKWRVVGSQAQLDNVALNFAKFDISSGQTVGSTTNSMSVLELNTTNGLYIQLNDPNFQFQVLKAVVYNSSGAIVAQVNTLIPGFYANPSDYQYNSDGSARSVSLQQMHALYGQTVTGWTNTQFTQYFDQYCF